MFENSAISFRHVLSRRVLEILMRVERSKYVGGVENIRPIGYSFRVFDIRWPPRGLKLEQNEKNIYFLSFDYLSHPFLAFLGLLG